MYEGWSGLIGSLQTGNIAFDQVLGCDLWEFYRRKPKSGAIFNEAMRLIGKHNSPQVASAYDWGRFAVIADIGGGVGALLVEILDAYPSCRGILFDNPKVVRQAIPHERLEPTGGNSFESVPSGADAYLLRWIIHDRSEEKAVTLLISIRKAMKPGARLILLEELIPDGAEVVPGKWLDVLMLAITGGRERTQKEYRDLFLAVGFELGALIRLVRSWRPNVRASLSLKTKASRGLINSSPISSDGECRMLNEKLHYHSPSVLALFPSDKSW